MTAGALRAAPARPHPGRAPEALVGGELVWECDSVYLGRGAGTDDAPRGDSPPALPEGPPVARWRLPDDLGRAYAGVSGDLNPIHLHPLSAKAMGFRRQIAHGMWTCARTLGGPGAHVARTVAQPGVVHRSGVPARHRRARRRPRG